MVECTEVEDGEDKKKDKIRPEQEWRRREVHCWDSKVICAEEEQLNGVFWSLDWDRSCQLLVAWNDCALTKRDTEGDEWLPTAYWLPSWHRRLCLRCLVQYTQTSAGSGFATVFEKKALLWNQAFDTDIHILGTGAQLTPWNALNSFTCIMYEWERQGNSAEKIVLGAEWMAVYTWRRTAR